MLLVIDVGNTNIKLGLYDKDVLTFKATISTNRQKTADEHAADLLSIFRVYDIDEKSIGGSIISCVVPAVTTPIKMAVKMVTKVKPLIVGPGIKTGLNIKTNNPAVLGGDLVVGLVAAAELMPCPCIVFNLGSATTIFVLNEEKEVVGGSIMAGVSISLEALTNKCALLPAVSFESPEKVIGKNSDECIRSGTILGAAAMMDGMIDRIEEELSLHCTVVATGGMSGVVVPHCKREVILHDNLLLEGLKIVYNRNKGKS